MNKKLFFCGLLFLIGYSIFASVPTGYYNSLEGKKAAALKTELHNIICQDTTHYLGYGSGKGNTWEGFYYTDRDATSNAVIDMYSDSIRYYPNPNPNFTAFGSTIEIEHSVPKSWWGCDITHPDCPARDLNHLYPADGKMNMAKNDNPLGVVTGTPTSDNGASKVGPATYDGYVGNVFEPADKYKGDFARSYFYMATAYEHYARKWDTSKPENMMQNNSYPVFKPWALTLLLQWHRQDVVSLKETTRNETVYGIQKNRNPFIDHPELIEYIWGNLTTVPYRLDGSITFPYLNWPNDNDTINLGNTFYQLAKDTIINLKANNLTGNLTLTLGGINATNFSLDKSSLSIAEAQAGTSIKLHYQANAVGNQSAILTISGGGITSINLRIKTTTTDQFSALPASSATNSGFTATWTPSSGATGYSLNVYSIENTGTTPSTVLEQDFSLALPNLWTKEGYTDNSLAGFIKMGTATTYGKITTPALDLSKGTSTLLVRAKQYSNDTGAPLTATLDGQTLATWTTAVASQDFTVNLPVSTAASKIALATVSGKRVYIDYMNVIEQLPATGPVSVSGYPKSLGNILSYPVSGLQSSKTYYYTVTPIGNGGLVSNQVAVQTTMNTAVNQPEKLTLSWSVTPDGVLLQHLSGPSEIVILDATGREITTVHSVSSDVLLPITKKAIYLLQIRQNQSLYNLKVIR